MVLREMRNNGDYYHADRSLLMEPSSNPFPFSSSPPPLPPSSSPPLPHSFSPSANGVAAGYIEHPVSKFDTLAGVAIKYGVEVADIKKMNGLVTDLQMFGLKTLHIPLPGRHPPSPGLLNGSEFQGPSSQEHSPVKPSSDLFDSFKLKSPSDKRGSTGMCALLQENQPTNHKVYLNGKADRYSNPPLSHHRKCRSLAYDLWLANGDLSNDLLLEDETPESEKWIESLVRRRQKSEADFNYTTPEKLLKDDAFSGASFSATAGKGVALRAKSASKAAETAEGGWPSNIGLGLWDTFVAASTNGVRKSFSTPSFQDPDTNSSSTSSSSSNSAYSSLWPVASKWSSLKPDLQALSNAALARPILDGLANNPITGRRNKTAVD